jgi:hypothetical protein
LDKKANSFAVIICIALVTIFAYFNRYKFQDENFPQVFIALSLFFEFIFLAGVLETIKNKKSYANIINVIFGTLLIFLFYYIFTKGSDFGKTMILIVAIFPGYMIIDGFYKIYKNLELEAENNRVTNIILMIFQVTSFILVVLQLLQIFNVIE